MSSVRKWLGVSAQEVSLALEPRAGTATGRTDFSALVKIFFLHKSLQGRVVKKFITLVVPEVLT